MVQTINPNQPFNFATENAKIKRQADVARMLQEQGMQSTPGQYIRNGDFIGYVGNTPLSAVADLLTSYMGKKAGDKAEEMQAETDQRQSSAVQEVAKKLQDMNAKGVAPHQVADGEFGPQPEYQAPTAADKAPVYEQAFATESPLAKLLVQGDIARSTARPTYDEVDPTKDMYVTDPATGRRTLVKAGQAKKTELDNKVDMLMQANPTWTRQQAVAAATGALGLDPQSGLIVNKYDLFNGQQPAPATPQNAPAAASNAPAAPLTSGDAVAVPGRGVSFAGPGSAPAASTPAQFRQQQIEREQAAKDAKAKQDAQERLDKNAPKIQEAQSQVVQIDGTLAKLNRINELVKEDPSLIGPLNGNRTKLRAIGGDTKAVEMLKLLDDLKMLKGRIDLKGQGAVSDWERKLSAATLPDIYTASPDAMGALLGNLSSSLEGERGTYATQLKTYGAELPERKAPTAPAAKTSLRFN